MSSNILTGKPNSCADGVLTGSIHLGNSQLGKPVNTISPEYTETTIELSKRATPKDCANCIGKVCMLKVDEDKVRGDRLQETHSNMIANDPRDRLNEAYVALANQSAYFDLKAAEPQKHLLDLAVYLAKSGYTPRKLAEIGLPEIDIEAVQDQAA